ncbi:helix-turn-helix domain-containing protein [uncultured Oscillibacter sp.]|uniref:helix-turn-helix domain-containing protein n=1 Tax=uncultured Oscillibacter sp. TaxID=876091 RepID=UPI002172CA22|nr:helix-turn-helix transcriptional regulator [uncultured Oscillibacter sp.]MCI9011650.1 helix-turn-helix transcriptional regulator [Oscillibacter sp.]
MEQLAKNLRLLREAKKLSREKVSRVLELSSKTYERYEKNGGEPTAPTLVKLADLYGVTLDQLVGLVPLPLEEEHR